MDNKNNGLATKDREKEKRQTEKKMDRSHQGICRNNMDNNYKK